MRKATIIGSLLVLALFLGLPGLYAQQPGAPAQGGWNCPWMGQGGSTGQGWHCPWMGQGTSTDQSGWFCPMTAWGCAAHFNQGQPLTNESAKLLIQDYLKYGNSPNLKIGDVRDKGTLFEAEILTKEGSRVDTLQVDKNTHWFRYAP